MSFKKDKDGRSNIDGAMVVAASGVQGNVKDTHLTCTSFHSSSLLTKDVLKHVRMFLCSDSLFGRICDPVDRPGSCS